MNRKIFTLLFVSMTFALASCSKLRNERGDANMETMESPSSEISQNLFQKYIERFPAFRFESSLRVRNHAGDEEKIREARSLLEINESHAFHLVRLLLGDAAPTEVLFTDREYFLKLPGEKKFRHVRYQAEFERWLDLTLSETVSYFEQLENQDPVPGTAPEQECYRSKFHEFCRDRQSGLLLSGKMTRKLSDTSLVEIEFSLAPASPGSIVIVAPQLNAQ